MKGIMKKNLIEDDLHRTHLLITEQHGIAPCLQQDSGERP
jgi:hypothetical protein